LVIILWLIVSLTSSFFSVIMNPLFYVTSIFFAGLAMGLASIGSGIGQGTPLDIVGALLLIGLIAVFCYYSFFVTIHINIKKKPLLQNLNLRNHKNQPANSSW